MSPFLKQVAEVYYTHHLANLKDMAFVFPSRRAGLFFKKHLASLGTKPFFSPQIYTVNEFFMSFSTAQEIDKIPALFQLYDSFCKITQSQESFDYFLNWGEVLLGDFEDIDKQLADPEQLFRNLMNIKDIDKEIGNYFSEDQIDAIKSFWSSFETSDEEFKNSFLKDWCWLSPVYFQFREDLKAQGLATEGMIFRDIAERAKTNSLNVPYQRVVFVGLHVLSGAEIALLDFFKREDIADFYWDYDPIFTRHKANKAALFSLKNEYNYPSLYTLNEEKERELPEIEIIPITSGIGQVKIAQSLLEKRIDDLKNEEKAFNTAIVLPDETLLEPLLFSLPEEISAINITMGYPLHNSSFASFIHDIAEIQIFTQKQNNSFYYHYHIRNLLSHPFMIRIVGEAAKNIQDKLIEENLVYIPFDFFAGEETPDFIKLILNIDSLSFDPSQYLLTILEYLVKITLEKEDESTSLLSPFEQEFIFYFHKMIIQLKSYISSQESLSLDVKTYFQLLKKLTSHVSVHFEGEPLAGLQIMGMLETRALDFEHIILLSFNEGKLPAAFLPSSFIPYNLRKGYGLQTYEHQESLWAYYFYRLLLRSKKISLIYDQRSDALSTGEVSRYFYQMIYDYQLPIKIIEVNQPNIKLEKRLFKIERTEEVQKNILKKITSGELQISASAINDWLDCPLKFYLTYVENLREEDEIVEQVNEQILGTLTHAVAEELYRPHTNQIIEASFYSDKLKSSLPRIIKKIFSKEVFNSEKDIALEGMNRLVSVVVYRFVNSLLAYDKTITPFVMLPPEKRFKCKVDLSGGHAVTIKGFIDRMDRHRHGKEIDTIHITDYKTGRSKNKFKDISDLFDPEANDRPKAIFQVFFYCFALYQTDKEFNNLGLQPHILSFRSMSIDEDTNIYCSKEKPVSVVEDYRDFHETFKEALIQCLDEILITGGDFTPTDKIDRCTYCRFKSICGR